MLTPEYKTKLEQYIVEYNIPEHTAKKLRNGNDGDIYFLLERQMPLTKVLNSIERNHQTERNCREYIEEQYKKQMKIY